MRPKRSPARTRPARAISRIAGLRRGKCGHWRFPARTQTGQNVPGSPRRARFAAAAYRTTILEKLDEGLTVQRIWQTRRRVRVTAPATNPEAVCADGRAGPARGRRVSLCAGSEGQIDFFRGAPTFEAARASGGALGVPSDARPLAPWVRGSGLGPEAGDVPPGARARVPRPGGVPLVIRHDNLKAAVVRPASSIRTATTSTGLRRPLGFTPLPTRPRNPKENGKQERSGGYVKSNALKGRRFRQPRDAQRVPASLESDRGRLRIHGTTRRQVWTHFVEVERAALQPVAVEPFPFFTTGERTVHTDGHVEVGSAFYPVPLALLGQRVRGPLDAHLVRVFHGDTLVAVHVRVAPGVFARRPAKPRPPPDSRPTWIAWSASAAAWGRPCSSGRRPHSPRVASGPFRLIQGVLGLTRRHPRERVLAAVTEAHARHHFRYHTIRQLVERTPPRLAPALTTTDPSLSQKAKHI